MCDKCADHLPGGGHLPGPDELQVRNTYLAVIAYPAVSRSGLMSRFGPGTLVVPARCTGPRVLDYVRARALENSSFIPGHMTHTRLIVVHAGVSFPLRATSCMLPIP